MSLQVFAQAHVVQLTHRTRRQPISARLVPRKVLFLDDQDVDPCLSEPVRGSGSGRTAPYDENITFVCRWMGGVDIAADKWCGHPGDRTGPLGSKASVGRRRTIVPNGILRG